VKKAANDAKEKRQRLSWQLRSEKPFGPQMNANKRKWNPDCLYLRSLAFIRGLNESCPKEQSQ
jgi:hypothetical protein